MKKTLLLSVVASSMIMAGGDIAPVEPMAPVVEASNWDFSGQAVVYYQTWDRTAGVDLFDQAGARANAGIQLRAVNSDIAYGIGAGVEVSGVATLGLENDIVNGVMQGAGVEDALRGGWISQAYLTYGFGNTSIKAGRQELPKSLSPFAFSEGWNVFKNTFDAILAVNTDIADTVLVGAWVEGGNYNNVLGAGTGAAQGPIIFAPNGHIGGNMADFEEVNGGAGVFMLTAQNKSVAGLTLTGSWYYAADYLNNITGANIFHNDANILWADASYGGYEGFTLAGQVGTVMSDDFSVFNGFESNDDTLAWGLKAGGNYDIVDLSLAYSSVDDGGVGVFNVGGVKTPLYTQMIFNQDAIRYNSDTFVAKAAVKALNGKFGVAYGYSDMGTANRGGLIDGKNAGAGEYSELDITYKTKVFNDTTTLFAGYIYQDRSYDDKTINDWSDNTLRLWGRYNF